MTKGGGKPGPRGFVFEPKALRSKARKPGDGTGWLFRTLIPGERPQPGALRTAQANSHYLDPLISSLTQNVLCFQSQQTPHTDFTTGATFGTPNTCKLSHSSHVQLCNPTDSSPPGFSVHGLFQARILEWVAISSSTGSSRCRDRTQVIYISCMGRLSLPLSYQRHIWNQGCLHNR